MQGADFDLRLLRREMNFNATRVFDTVIAARLLGIREFSLAALVERYFGVKLTKGSQKANWAQRPLAAADGGVRDERHALPAAARRRSWKRNCARGTATNGSSNRASAPSTQAPWSGCAMKRKRGASPARAHFRAAPPPFLRALWQWREKEAQAADRPSFHILQNHLLLRGRAGFRCRPGARVPPFFARGAGAVSWRRRARLCACRNPNGRLGACVGQRTADAEHGARGRELAPAP